MKELNTLIYTNYKVQLNGFKLIDKDFTVKKHETAITIVPGKLAPLFNRISFVLDEKRECNDLLLIELLKTKKVPNTTIFIEIDNIYYQEPNTDNE